MAALCVVCAVCAASACGATRGAATPPPGTTGSSPHPASPSGNTSADVIAPLPATAVALDALPAVPPECPQPPQDAGDLRPVEVESSWRTVTTDSEFGELGLLAVGGDGAVWASYRSQRQVGAALESSDGGLRRWDGTAWESFTLPAVPGRGATQVVALAASSKDRAWAVGNSYGEQPQGFVGAYDGGRWRVRPLSDPAAQVIGWGGTAAADTGTEFWTVNGKLALHNAGDTWRSYDLPGSAGAIDGDWVVSGSIHDAPAAMRWQGSGWQAVGVPVLGVPDRGESPRIRLHDVVELGPRDVWVVGGVSWMVPGEFDEENEPLELTRPVALRWNGGRWRCSWGAVGSAFTQAEPDGRGGLWVLHGSRLLHGDGERWTSEHAPGTISALARRPGTSEVYAAGAIGRKDGLTRAALWRSG